MPSRRAMPIQSRPCSIDGWELYFAGVSKAWSLSPRDSTEFPGSAVAFIQKAQSEEQTVQGRAYLMTYEQFIDILLMENGRDIASFEPERDALRRRLDSLAVNSSADAFADDTEPGDIESASADDTDSKRIADFDYSLVARLPDMADEGGVAHPAMTFSTTLSFPSSSSNGTWHRRMPSAPYITTIALGLAERAGGNLDVEQAVDYLVKATGDTWYRPLLERILEQAADETAGGNDREESLIGVGEVVGTGNRVLNIREPIIQVSQKSKIPLPEFWHDLWLRWRTARLVLGNHERVVVKARSLPCSPGVLAIVQRKGTSHIEDGQVGVDQKIRTALGLKKIIPGFEGDEVEIHDWPSITPNSYGYNDEDWIGKIKVASYRFRAWCNSVLERIIGSQAELLRVEISTFDDMELDIARIPAPILKVLGVNEGEQVLLESPTGNVKIRALAYTDGDRGTRELHHKDHKLGKYVYARELFGLDRLPGATAPGEDIAPILIDAEVRHRLGLVASDTVRVSRHAGSAFQAGMFALATPLTGTIFGIIFVHCQVGFASLDKEIAWSSTFAFVGLLIFLVVMLIVNLRQKVV